LALRVKDEKEESKVNSTLEKPISKRKPANPSSSDSSPQDQDEPGTSTDKRKSSKKRSKKESSTSQESQKSRHHKKASSSSDDEEQTTKDKHPGMRGHYNNRGKRPTQHRGMMRGHGWWNNHYARQPPMYGSMDPMFEAYYMPQNFRPPPQPKDQKKKKS